MKLLLLGAAVASALSAQSITLDPGYTTIGVNQTVQYKAKVTGLMNTSVTWSVSNQPGGSVKFGTITSNGLYTAPAVVPADGITVSALGSDGHTLGIVYVNVAPAGPAILSASPNPIPTGSYTVTLTGVGFQPNAIIRASGINLQTTFINSTTLKGIGWQGTVQPGIFQVQNPGTLFGAALSVPFVLSGPPPAQVISPSVISVNLGATQQFTSSGATGYTASAGTISASGLYTAPAAMPATPAVKITATGPGGTAVATVTLIDPNAQSIAPAAISVNLGASQQFSSAGATSWTAVSGTVTATGLYTAPALLPGGTTDTVTATGPNGVAKATVTLVPPTPVITAAGNNGQIALGIFTATVTGTGFQANSTASLNGTPLSATFLAGALKITGFAAQSGAANLTVSTGALISQPFAVQVGISNAPITAAAARRFLEQAGFGPTPGDAAHLQAIGYSAWLAEQFAMPQVSDYNGISGNQGGMPQRFLTNAVMNADQLRQRVGFALSQIFVTSLNTLIWNNNQVLLQNMLLSEAFGNYRQLMGDVTLSPAMGQYLGMANNGKAVPAQGIVANENFARELLQLFTVGTVALNPDGSKQYDANNIPVPTYSQFTITEFARVFTGWTYAPAPGGAVVWNSYISSYGPMVPVAAQHDSFSKQLLSGPPASAGLSPQQDLNFALDNIFNHPNVGPFVAKWLIQHLVKSKPSPAYIANVAAAFNNNGQNVRGDLKAVITAILLDPEARANDNGGNDQPADGHLQEPALFLSGMVRAFGGQMNDTNYYAPDLAALGQDLFNSPSVFNYYAPGNEMQIHTPNNAIVRANLVHALFGQYQNPVQSNGPGTSLDLSPFIPLAGAPATLASALDLTLTHGTMPPVMKTAVVNAIIADAGSPLHKVQTACYLILTSGYYNVWH